MLSMNFKQRAKCFHVGEGGGAGEEEVGGGGFFFEFMSIIFWNEGSHVMPV